MCGESRMHGVERGKRWRLYQNLTYRYDIQSAAGDLLGSTKGAVVVMEPSTGRILAMQAYPDFDPNTVSGDWDYLTTDEDSPLVNRATQGLYPPGSTFKIITALAAMECVPDWQSFTYDCRGEAEFENKVIHCYNNKAHGTVDMEEAMAESCNCYFAALAEKIGAENLSKVMKECGILSDYGFAPNSVEQPQKILVFVASSTCTSKPMTVSYSFFILSALLVCHNRKLPCTSRLFVCRCRAKQLFFLEAVCDHLKPDRKSL